MEPVLSFDHVSFAYHTIDGETPAVSDLNFSVDSGRFTVLVGPSGCGKSTLLSLACGLLKPESGTVKFKNRDTVPIGYMFQKDHLFEWRTVYQNAMLAPELQRNKEPEIISYVDEMLSFYGLKDFSASHPSALSGGMRQRAALIRTLASRPELLILDEPFSALDYQTRLEVADDITMLIRNSKKTVLMVTHDLSEAVSIADRIIVLSGRPCHVKAEIAVDFPETVTSPHMRRQHPHFSELFNLVWKELKRDETPHQSGTST